MKGRFRLSMAWLHTWAGLTFCWILYFMFVTGTLGYFDAEIDRWMMPEETPTEGVPVARSLDTALAYLAQEAEGADRWQVTFPGGRNDPHLRVFWQGPEPEEEGEEVERGNERLDISTGEPMAEPVRDTGGGQVLYQMHYSLHYLDRGAAFRFIGVVALFMFIGLVTGVIIHRRIFRDLFTLRPANGQRSWLDAHNLLSVSSLPFQLMITYSGLIFTVTTWMPAIAIGSYGFDFQKAGAELGAIADIQIERSGTPAELTDLHALVAQGEELWGEGAVRRLDVRMPGDANARVLLSPDAGIGVVADQRIYDGVTGEYLDTLNPASRAPIAFASTMIGLHEGLFAGPLLRWLYFFSGLLGAGMVATGAIYWTAKRRRQALADGVHSRGYRFVDSLNLGTILGLPVAIAVYFWANRLLPLGLEGRAQWEMHCLFLAWALCLLYPVARPREVAWRDLSWVAAFAFGALPIVNAATTEAHLFNTVRDGDWVLASFDLTALGCGLAFAAVASVIGRRHVEVPELGRATTREVPAA
ncbi:MAG: PepSY-associated TM helix domain-containing protein [Acidobacteriota bacterium]